MQLSKFQLYISFYLTILSSNIYAGEATPCQIAPGSRAAIVTIECKNGESKTVIDADTAVESDDSYNLIFKKSLFNAKRIVQIKDLDTGVVMLRIEVTNPHEATIKSLIDDKTWIFKGLAAAHLDQLTIQTQGKLVINESLELDKKLNIESNSLYILNPFSIKNGTFRLKYQEGFVSRLNFPFQAKVTDNYSILESLNSINCPSKRRVNLNSIKKVEFDVPTADLLSAYNEAFSKKLEEDHPKFLSKITEDEMRFYIKNSIFSKITDNVKKGIIGESIYRSFMARKYPHIEFNNPKVGLNSFDAVHMIHEIAEVATSPIRKVFISEVKYAANGKPLLGVIKLDGKEWRQLSLPYVNNKLDKMTTHSATTRKVAAQIRAHSARVKLRLAVFNPDSFKLVIYKVGNLSTSTLD